MASTPPQNLPAQILARLDDLIGRKNQFVNEVQAWAGGPPTGGPNHDGRYPFTDAAGFQAMVESPQAIASRIGTVMRGPEFFGAIGDGGSHPARNYFPTLAACQLVYSFATSLAQEIDWLAWQKMVKTTGDWICPVTTYKMCNPDPDSQQPLDWSAGVCDVDASFSVLDWTDMRPKTTEQHVFDNYDFHSPEGWKNADIYGPDGDRIVFVKFDQGAAIGRDPFNDPARPGRGPYYAFGHLIQPAAGRYRVYVEGTITRGQSYDFGNVGPPYAYVNFSSQYGVDQGGWSGSSRYTALTMNFDAVDPVNTPAPFSGQFDIEIPPNAPPGYLMFKGGGYMNLRLTRLDIMPFVPNAAILNNRDHSPAHNFMAKRFRRATLLGPPQQWQGLTCQLCKSFNSIDGDLHDWEQIRAFGWSSAVEWSDGAYLLHYYHCYLLSEGRGLYFGEGTLNAGENIKFFGGVAAAGNYVFNNPGSGEFTLFGVATDYNGKGLCENNSGLIRMIGTRHEQSLPANAPVWHCTTGRVIYEASFCLFAGPVGQVGHPPAKLDTSNASIEFHSTQVYNMSSGSGYASTGPGRIEFFGFLNSGNPNIGLEMVTDSPNQDLLGSAGKFEPGGPGSIYMSAIRGSELKLEGGLWNEPFQGHMIDQWNSTAITARVSADYFYQGTRSLKIAKTSGADNTRDQYMLFKIPIPRPGNVLGRMRFLFPNPVDPAFYPPDDPDRLVLIYHRHFWMQEIGLDALGRPMFSERVQFKGEGTIKVPKAGSQDWLKRNFSSLYQNATTDNTQSDKAPSWANCFVVSVEMQSAPAMTFYIDGLEANFLG